MDLQSIIAGQMAKMKQDEYSKKPIKTLGELILILENQPQNNVVKLDFTEGNPYGLASYRGYYEDLAIEYDSNQEEMTVKELLKECNKVDGKTLLGYKGGDFYMSRKTLVWASPYGECTKRMVIGVKSKNKTTTILTELQED